MVALEFINNLKSLELINYIGVEDFPDRLNFYYTVVLLLVCCTIVTVRTYFLQPLACYIPNMFGATDAGQENFVNNYCWTEGTYAVHPKDFTIDNDAPDGGMSIYEDKKIIYYQWVPFVLGIQCIFFYLPRVFWRVVSYNRAGTDIGHILRTANDAVNADEETRVKLIEHVCRRLEQMLFHYRTLSTNHSLKEKLKQTCWKYISYIMPSQFTGSWLILLYFLVKTAYLLNSVSQLLIMHGFLNLNSTKYTFYGIQILKDLSQGKDWENTMIFPRVGCCAVFLKSASHGNWQFSQCTLPINMINEKIFIFLWFWMTFICICNITSILAWVFRVYTVSCSTGFVKKYLQLADNYVDVKKHKYVKKFVKEFLRHDGTFILKMIALNSGDVVCAEIFQGLWKMFLKKRTGFSAFDDDDNRKPVGLMNIFNEHLEIVNCKNKKRLSVPVGQRLNPTAPPIASIETLMENEFEVEFKHSNSYS